MKKTYFCGVDVSNDTLDLCFLTNNDNIKPKYEKLPNNKEVLKAYFNSFVNDDILVVLEYTNNYHIALQEALSELKIKYSVLNPNKTSHFLKHLTHIKSDLTDSYGLALYCKMFKSDINPSKYNKEYMLIKSYNTTSELLSKITTQLKNLKKSQSLTYDKNIEVIVKDLIKHIDSIKEKLNNIAFELLKQYIPQTEQIIKDSKGIGKDLALKLFPQLYFNRFKNAKEFISFIGLSPRIYESGTSVKKSKKINKIGSNTIRKALFMSAMSCIRFNDKFKTRYNRIVL
ncbi:IS110 family transposase [Campylobacter pinnipediorum subsp. pinnipediorum]|uniref:transposase n=1 Tax=Campylobacter pinnipediorum TaxID=1965231 RepID=UPI000995B2E5|nr:transposase [Campylobacter pinnipediorum]AQW84196.1 IS110 family transposase [Campylobacter pinnipediorum subsp. pinnipediorum]